MKIIIGPDDTVIDAKTGLELRSCIRVDVDARTYYTCPCLDEYVANGTIKGDAVPGAPPLRRLRSAAAMACGESIPHVADRITVHPNTSNRPGTLILLNPPPATEQPSEKESEHV